MAYTYYSAIEIEASAVAANETNFAVALTLTDSRFATVGNGGHIQNTDANGGASGALTVPADFVASPNIDGSSPFDFEFEKYNPATGEIALWIEIPSLSSSSNTTIYLVYGDSGVTTSQEDVAGTWDSQYRYVNNLAGASGTACKDSTSNNNDPTEINGTHTYQQAGQFGYCVAMQQAGPSTITSPDHATLDFGAATDFTLEALVKVPALASGKWTPIIYKRHGGTDQDLVYYQLMVYDNDGNGGHVNAGADDDVEVKNAVGTDILDDSSWHYIAAVFDRDGNLQIYTDGSTDGDPVDISGLGDIDNDNQFDLGRDSGSGALVGGDLTLVRVRADVMDADEITTTHNYLFSPGSFWSALGSEIAVWHLSLSGAITPVGAITKKTTRSLAGGVTPSGDLGTVIRFIKAVGGSVTPSGALSTLSQFFRSLGGGIIPEGVITKKTTKSVGGGMTPTGGVVKKSTRDLAGGIMPSGDLGTQLRSTKAVEGSLTPTGVVSTVCQFFRSLAGSITPVGTLTKILNPSGIVARLRTLLGVGQ